MGLQRAVRRWQEAVHASKRYDLAIDSSTTSPEEAATAILAALDEQMPRTVR